MVRSSELLAKLEDLNLILRERRLRWFGHVSVLLVQSEQHVIYRLVAGGGGRPKLTWKKLTEKDCLEWKLTKLTLKKGAPGDQV